MTRLDTRLDRIEAKTDAALAAELTPILAQYGLELTPPGTPPNGTELTAEQAIAFCERQEQLASMTAGELNAIIDNGETADAALLRAADDDELREILAAGTDAELDAVLARIKEKTL